MEDSDYAGINFGVIAFLYLLTVIFILKFNTKLFNKSVKNKVENTPKNYYLDLACEALICLPYETKKNRKLV